MGPNFFIIGAPKCGTSTLYNWLAQHPDVGSPVKKELFYYMDHGHPLIGQKNYHSDGVDGISQFYLDHALSRAIVMEATTHYLYQDTALKVLSGDPSNKVCILLRQPASRVLSSFEYTANNLSRVRPNVTYSDINLSIQKGKKLYPNLVHCKKSAYVLERDQDYSQYSKYVAKWIDAMGRDRVKILISEELFSDPQPSIEELLCWLDLKPEIEGLTNARSNETYRVKSNRLHRHARRYGQLFSATPKFKRFLKKIYVAINQSEKSKSEPPRKYGNLTQSSQNEKQRLEALLGRTINAWS